MHIGVMKNVYFIGIGGIGMSALARYFKAKGLLVTGYDLTASPVTVALENEGIPVHFSDDVSLIPALFKQREETLVIYTPAVPSDHKELAFFRAKGFEILKRAEALGLITGTEQALCVAGTHGKTTTSTFLAYLLKESTVDCNAFLGGISANFNSNLLLSDKSDLVVIEADEFDRSFHHLTPYMAIITSADPDHLDIYGTKEAYQESFEHFTSLIVPNGTLIIKKGSPITPRCKESVKIYSYSATEKADFWADNIRSEDGRLFFDWHTPDGLHLTEIELGVPMRINVENAVAAMAAAYLNGVSTAELSEGVKNFRGTHRRFERVLQTDRVTLIDDYAHHPVEVEASISSLKELYKDKRILGIFQPHLYSRTADFYEAFAKSLSALDEVILIDIYPAREQPIADVSSEMIAKRIPGDVPVVAKTELLDLLKKREIPEVVIMMGAGDIDRLVKPVAEYLESLC